MATSLIIKDGIGAIKSLAVNSGSEGFVPLHGISGTVNVTASSENPVSITGTVSVIQPISVDLVVGDNLFVTSSISAPLYISSSTNSPILTTGTVNVNNFPTNYTVTSSFANPVATTGTVNVNNFPANYTVTSSFASPVATTGTVNVNNFPTLYVITSSNNNAILITGTVNTNNTTTVSDGLRVTSSVANPLWISASFANPIAVTGAFATTVADGLRVTSSYDYPLLSIISSSVTNPVWITGSVLPAVTATINISATASVGATVTASIYGSPSVSVSKNKLRVGSAINYDASTSGTFELAPASTSRKGLVVHNSSGTKLFIVIGSGTLNGFSDVQDLQDEPNSYSFILYPSGTYIADLSLVNLFHGGWFVSSSNVDGASVFSTTTE